MTSTKPEALPELIDTIKEDAQGNTYATHGWTVASVTARELAIAQRLRQFNHSEYNGKSAELNKLIEEVEKVK